MVRVILGIRQFSSQTGVRVLLLAVLVRGGMLLVTRDAFRADPDGYRAVAENLVEHGTFGNGPHPTAYRPPLYPCVLAACLATGPASRAAIGLLHLALGIGTVWLTHRFGLSCGLGRLAWLAAVLVACDPILLVQSPQVMTETLATFLATAALVCLAHADGRNGTRCAIGAGSVVGLCVLCRPTFLPWAILLTLALSLRQTRIAPGPPFRVPRDELERRSYGVVWAFATATAVVLAPWAIRNQVQFGRPIVTTTHGGYTLLLANNPDFYGYLRSAPWGTVWDGKELDRAWTAKIPRGTAVDEIRADRLAYSEAIENIRREPAMFGYACLVRIGRLFGLTPKRVIPNEGILHRLLRYGVGFWYAVEMALAVLGAAVIVQSVRRHQIRIFEWACSALLVACFLAAHAVYWTDMRMRAPLMPVLASAAVLGAGCLGGWVRGRKLLISNELSSPPSC